MEEGEGKPSLCPPPSLFKDHRVHSLPSKDSFTEGFLYFKNRIPKCYTLLSGKNQQYTMCFSSDPQYLWHFQPSLGWTLHSGSPSQQGKNHKVADGGPQSFSAHKCDENSTSRVVLAGMELLFSFCEEQNKGAEIGTHCPLHSYYLVKLGFESGWTDSEDGGFFHLLS